MRILLITQWWEPDEGPPQWRLRRFTDALLRAGHSVDVVTSPPHYPGGSLTSSDPLHCSGAVDDREPGVTVHRTCFRPHTQSLASRIADQAVVLVSSLRIGRALARSGHTADVVMTSVPALPSAVAALALSRAHGAPLVIDLRDAWPDLLAHVASPRSGPDDSGTASFVKARLAAIPLAVTRAALTTALRKAELVTTTSEWLSRDLAERGVTGVLTLRNSPVVQRVSTDRAPDRARPPSRELRVLYAGTVGRAQGLSNAIIASRMARDQGHDVTLRIVGSGAELAEVRNLAEAIGAPVEIHSPVAHAAMDPHYAWCDASLIHLREWPPLRSTVPSKLIESMARGVPVIAAADGETRVIIAEASAGESVPAMDAVALAELLGRWASNEITSLTPETTREWLSTHADAYANGLRLVAAVEALGRGNHVRHGSDLQARMLALRGLILAVSEKGNADYIHLATLVSRRLPAGARTRLTNVLSALAPGDSLRGLALLIGDERGLAEMHYRSARSGRLRDTLGLHLGMDVPENTSRGLRARRAWHLGQLSLAISLSNRRARSATQWRSVVRTLDPEFDPRPPVGPLPDLPAHVVAELGRVHTTGASLRVLHLLTNSVPHTESGYTLRTHSVLRAQAAAGVDSLAATRLGYPQSIGVLTDRFADSVDGITYLRLPAAFGASVPDRRLRRTTTLLLAIVEDFRPDVIHTTTNYENGVVASAVSRVTGIPWVYETRGEMEKTWQSRRRPEDQAVAGVSEYYRALRATEERLMADADAVIALSEVQKRSHITRGIDPDRIHVVRNSVDADVIDRPLVDSSLARRSCGLPEAFTVGSISSLVPYEGLDTLIRAVAEMRRSGLDVRGVIVGDGESRPELIRLRDELGLTDTVALPGRVPSSAVTSWYDAIDVFCVPRRDLDVTRSVTPLKPVHAMARRRPVVVSDLDALTEITSDLGAGIAVPADDPTALSEALRQLHDDPALYESYAASARTSAEQMTWTSAAARIRAVYENVVR